MRALSKINLALVTVLSAAAGLPKVGRIPQEVQFFAESGLGTVALVVFGALQLVGGAMMISRRSRPYGAVVAAVMFLGSALMLLLRGQVGFGLISLLPVVMAASLARRTISDHDQTQSPSSANR
jgi:uncharacterized membrane protein YphA (DoxX/SURF4 family)